MLAQASETPLLVRAIAFLLFTGVISVVVWGLLCVFRKFRTARAFGTVTLCAAALTGLLFAIPSPAHRKERGSEVAIAPSAIPATPTPAPERPKFWASPAAHDQEDKLAAEHIDEANGFAIRFPRGWTVRAIRGDPWIIEASDGVSAFMSIGPSPNPAGAENKVARLDPAMIERSILAKENAVLHASGSDQLQGASYLYFKYTALMPMTDSSPRMTMTHYLVPRTGRILEIRTAATPETFKAVEPTFNVSMSTFRLVPDPRSGAAQSNAER